MENIRIQCYHSPCGDLWLGAWGDRLCLCDWVEARHPGRVERRLQAGLRAEYEEMPSAVACKAMRQLDEYFRRERQVFDLPLLFVGTEFQKAVWKRLQEIPYGQTLTYASLAARMGMPRAVRAVAGANGANALSILVPCHRVVGRDGALTGYAGGTAAKRFLLELEQGENGGSGKIN